MGQIDLTMPVTNVDMTLQYQFEKKTVIGASDEMSAAIETAIWVD